MALAILVGSGFLTSLMFSIERDDEKETKDNKTKKKKQ